MSLTQTDVDVRKSYKSMFVSKLRMPASKRCRMWFRRSDRFLMKENTFHYLCNVRTSPNGFRCCEKWIRLYAKLLIKAFRGRERRRQTREERRTDYTNCVSLKHHFMEGSQHRQWKMRKTKLKGLHFPNWGFANVAEKCFYSFSQLVFPLASFSSADALCFGCERSAGWILENVLRVDVLKTPGEF